jgi:hypothetical protein
VTLGFTSKVIPKHSGTCNSCFSDLSWAPVNPVNPPEDQNLTLLKREQ